MRGTRVVGRNHCETDIPAGWTPTEPVTEDIDLALVGPENARGERPVVCVTVTPHDDVAIEDASVALMREVQEEYPTHFLASCDIWPHPVWKHGRFVQSAGVVDGEACARDCFIFVTPDQEIRIVVECPLDDLLSVEDSVADIVAHLRPVERND